MAASCVAFVEPRNLALFPCFKLSLFERTVMLLSGLGNGVLIGRKRAYRDFVEPYLLQDPMGLLSGCDEFVCFIEDIKTERTAGYVAALDTLVQIHGVDILVVDYDAAPKAFVIDAKGERAGLGSAQDKPGIVVNQCTDIVIQRFIKRIRRNRFIDAGSKIIAPGEGGKETFDHFSIF